MKKELLFNPKKAENAEMYVQKLNRILDANKTHEQNKERAYKRIEELRSEIEKINLNYLLEMDPVKTKEMADRREALEKEIRAEKTIDDVNLKAIFETSFHEVEQSKEAIESSKEYSRYYAMINDEIKAVEKEAREHVEALRQELNKHPHATATILRGRVKSLIYKFI